MERLLLHVIEGLTAWADVSVIGPSGCSAHLPAVRAAVECSQQPLRFLATAGVNAVMLCRRQHVNLVLGGSALVTPVLRAAIAAGAEHGATLVHGLDLAYPSRVFQWLCVAPLNRLDAVIANSQATRQLALQRGLHNARVSIVHPGVDLAKAPGKSAIDEFQRRFDIAFDDYILFCGRMTQRKGLSQFLGRCLPDILRAQPNTGVLVVGDEPINSLDQRGEKARVIQTVRDLGLHDSVRFIGHVSDEDLRCAMAGACVHVFPLVPVRGDVEGFGMVVIEAAAMGTATIAFDEGGVADAVGACCGALLKTGDWQSMTREVLRRIEQCHHAERQACLDHAAAFSWHSHAENMARSLAPLCGNPSASRA